MGKTLKAKMQDRYMELIRQFPLRKISTPAEHRAAMKFIHPLLMREHLSDGELEYVNAMVTLIKEFERKCVPANASGSPVEVLKHLMTEGNLSVNDIGQIIGSQSSASMILNHKRAISKTQAKLLGQHFGLNPGAFI